MDDFEYRLRSLEDKAKLLHPSGFTAKSFWTRVGTVVAYNIVLSIVVSIIGFILYLLIVLS